MGKSWTNDHDIIVNTILEERFAMANMVKHANLEIEKSKTIADQRLEAYRSLKQSTTILQSKFELFEKELGVISSNFSGNAALEGQLKRLFLGLDDLRNVLKVDIRSIHIEEPLILLGDIHGSEEGFIRLQSAFRTLERENELLREKYVKWQKEIPNAYAIQDKEKIIENLSNQIVLLTGQVSTFKSQSSVNVNVSSNTQEFEIKIRTLNSRIQELESQLRTQKVDYEGQIRSKNALVRDLEDKIANAAKVDDSRATGTNYGSTSNIDRLTSSVHSNSSSGTGSQISSNYGATSNVSVPNYGATTNTTATGGVKTYGTYGNSGAYGATSVPTGNVQPINTASSSYKPTSASGYGATTSSGVYSSTSSSGQPGTYGTGNLTNSGVGSSSYTSGATYGATTPATGTTGQAYGTNYGAISGSSGVSATGANYSTATGANYGTGATGINYGTGATGSSFGTGATGSSAYGSALTGARYSTSGASGQSGTSSSYTSASGNIGTTGIIGTSGSTSSGSTGTGATGTTGTTGTTGSTSYSPYNSYYSTKK